MRSLLLSLAVVACAYCVMVDITLQTPPLGELGGDEAYHGMIEGPGIAPRAIGQIDITTAVQGKITVDFGALPMGTIPDNLKFTIGVGSKLVSETTNTSQLISGVFQNQMAVLNANEIWTNDPFGSTAGTFFLATPTSAATDDECNGIWFFDGNTGLRSLDLPTLPPRWEFEGWVVDVSNASNPMPMSTGKFNSPVGRDSDGAGKYAGPGAAPDFPGQDYVQTVIKDLCQDYMAVISIEPIPDLDPAPFFLKLFSAAIMNVTGGSMPQTLTVNQDILPIVNAGIQVVPGGSPTEAPSLSGPIASGTRPPSITAPPTVQAPTFAPGSSAFAVSATSMLVALFAALALI